MSPVRRLALGPCLLLSLCGTVAAQKAEPQPTLAVQSAHSKPLTAVAFSLDPESKFVATASKDQTIKIWHTRTGQLLHTLTGHTDEVTGLAFSHDGQVLVSVSHDRTFGLWNVHTGRMDARIETHQGKQGAVACTKERLLAIGGEGHIIELHEFKEKGSAPPRFLRGHKGGINCLVFSPNGRVLASGSQDGTVKLWDAAGGTMTGSLDGHGRVLAVAFAPDGKTLAASSDDRTIRIWSVDLARKTATEKETLKAGAQVNTLAFGRSSKVLASGSEDNNLDLWDLDSGKRGTLKGEPGPVRAIDVSQDGKVLVSVGGGTGARLRDVDPDNLTGRLRGYRLNGLTDRVFGIALSPDGKSLASGMGQTIALWRFGMATDVQPLRGHTDQINAVAFSPDGKVLASAGGNNDRAIHYWDAKTGKHLHAFHAHSAEINAVTFSPDGKTLASTSLDRFLNLWEVPSGNKKGTLVAPNKDQFYAVAFSPDGKYLAAGTPALIHVWDARDLKLLHSLRHHDWRVLSLAFSSDSKLLASGNQDGTIKLWDVVKGKDRGTMDLHKNTRIATAREVFSLSFHPDGKILASGSNDKTVRLWDTTTCEELRRLPQHGHTVKAVSFSQDGSFLATGSGDGLLGGNGDGAIKLWSFKDGPPRRELCTLFAFPDETEKGKPPLLSWAVVDAKGRYDAVHGGDVRWLHWVINNEPVELRQLKTQYYEPRLLPKLLGFNPEKPRDVGPLEDTKLSPLATDKGFDAKKKQMTVRLDNRGGGIGRVQVLVNGKELTADARPDKAVSKADKAEITIDLSKAVLKGKGDEVQIITWDDKDHVSGRGLVREIDTAEAAPPPAIPRLYAIVVGTHRYANDRLNLNYSAKDAEDIARLLHAGGANEFGKDNVSITLLSTEGKPAAEQPTKANIEAAFKKVARAARPEDVLVVFFAGHGISLKVGEEDLYCYLTTEAKTMDVKVLADPAVRTAQTVSSEELVEWIKQVPALHQMMVLDTCAAGAAVDKLIDGQIRAVERLKDRTGFHVLMGCPGDRVSYESADYKQGLLTYALLEGMKRDAAVKGKTKVYSLFLHAAERVPELAKNLKGAQEPLISSPGSRSMASRQLNFSFAQFKDGDFPK